MKRIVTAALDGEHAPPRRERDRNFDAVAGLVREKVEKTEGRTHRRGRRRGVG